MYSNKISDTNKLNLKQVIINDLSLNLKIQIKLGIIYYLKLQFVLNKVYR